METNPTASSASYTPAPANRGMFGTSIPSSVAFVIAILLLILPLSEIKCGDQTILNQSGLRFALGKPWKAAGGTAGNMMGELSTKVDNIKKGNTQYFAIGVLALGILGLIICLMANPKGAGGGIICALLAAGCLIALWFEIKKGYKDWLTKEAAEGVEKGADSIGIGNNNTGTTLAFTPWFYIAVVAFLAAAFFCYKRMSSTRN